jgi:hypothetical protein
MAADGSVSADLEATATLDDFLSGAPFEDFNQFFAEQKALPATAQAPEPEPAPDPQAAATPSSPTATPPIGGVGASAGEQGRRLDRLPLELEVDVDGERQVVRGMASEWLAQSDARLDRLQKLRNCAKG